MKQESSEHLEAAFDRIYSQLEQFIYRPNTIELISLFCLRGVRATVSALEGFGYESFDSFKSIDLGQGLIIRRATKRELDLAHDHPGIWFGEPAPLFARGDFSSTPVVLEARQVLSALTDVHSKNERWQFREKALKRGQKVVSALQVLQPGPVAIGTVRHQANNPFLFEYEDAYSDHELDALIRDELSSRTNASNTGSVTSDESTDDSSRVERPVYWFPPLGIERLPDLVNRIEALGESNAISLALRRLNDSWHRRKPEDALIDSWIALEALFSPSDHIEISFRMALRIAVYIGEDGENAVDLFDQLKKSYRYRSDIAHGRPNVKVELEHEVFAARDYLYRALFRRLVEDIEHDGTRLEKEIIRSSISGRDLISYRRQMPRSRKTRPLTPTLGRKVTRNRA